MYDWKAALAQMSLHWKSLQLKGKCLSNFSSKGKLLCENKRMNACVSVSVHGVTRVESFCLDIRTVNSCAQAFPRSIGNQDFPSEREFPVNNLFPPNFIASDCFGNRK